MNHHAEHLIALDRAHVWHPYTQQATAPVPVPIASARGAWLHGVDGTAYLDLIASWWVAIHGHAHPVIAEAIATQAGTMAQIIFAGLTHEPAVRLAEALVKRLPAGLTRLFFSDDGSTAVEVAMKMALHYWRNVGQSRGRFLVFEHGYHGDTVGAMSASRSSGFFEGYGALLFDVDTVPFPATWEGDAWVEAKERHALEALDRYLERHGSDCAAMLIEPLIQGAGGMRICRPAFLRALVARLRGAGVLLIADEVMTGFGRCGTLFACERAGIEPDFICLSKGLTGGFLPMAITACHEGIYQAFLGETFDRALSHGHSFTANALGCAAGLASLALFDTEDTLARVAAIEALHRERLTALGGRILQPRAMGAVAAFELALPDRTYGSSFTPRLIQFFLEHGLIIRPLGAVLYLMPPYCITPEELHRGWDGIEAAVASFCG
ncbi:MAG: adenosylmethionine--8-amino-7-oxononanoate transaminase [Magnetococcales bacterium]|nr:adenosylmethionine--8-amino-7-oxononanoate transaminase [Magnetococcales bacterium]